MKKILFPLLLVFSMAILLTQGIVAQDNTKPIKDAKNGFSLSQPGNWNTSDHSLRGTTFYASTPFDKEDDIYSENISLIVQNLEGKDLDVRQFAELTTTQLEILVKNFKLIRSEPIEKNGWQGHELIYEGKQGHYTLKFKQYIVINKGTAYVLTYTGEINSFDQHLKEADIAFDSFNVF